MAFEILCDNLHEDDTEVPGPCCWTSVAQRRGSSSGRIEPLLD